MKTNIQIQTAQLSKNSRITLSRARRNVKEFLPPDQVARRRSGYSRKIDLNDAFRVILGTHLVSALGYSFFDARMIIDDLWPWAMGVALLPEGNSNRTGIDKEIVNYDVRIITDMVQGGFYYQILGTLNNDSVELNDDFRKRVKKISSTVYLYEIAPRGYRCFDLLGAELLSSKILKIQAIVMCFLADFGPMTDESSFLLKMWASAREIK